jgi:hypothetical protein
MRDYTGVQRRKAFDGERKAGRTRGLLAGSVREKLLVVREKKDRSVRLIPFDVVASPPYRGNKFLNPCIPLCFHVARL